MSHINPRFRAYGKARLDIARRARTRADWQQMWKPTMHPFAFRWGARWKHCIEYRVDDFAAEVGFFIDVLGFPVSAFNDAYAMFTSPDEAFHLAVLPADEMHPAAPPDALRLQFMITALEDTVAELERRGVAFSVPPQPLRPGSSMHIAVFHTPHGLTVELWSEARPREARERLPLAASASAERPPTEAVPAPPDVPPPPPRLPRVQETPPAPKAERAPAARQPSSPVVPVRSRSRQARAWRTNRLPLHFVPVPTHPRAAGPAEEQPEQPAAPPEPEYEDLPEAGYYEEDF